MYRNRKAAEVRIETPADVYKASMAEKIAEHEAGARRGKGGRRCASRPRQLREEIAAAGAEAEERPSRR